MSNFTQEEVMAMLKDGRLIIPVKGGKYIVSSILAKHLKTKHKIRCANYPEKFIGLSDSLIYKKIMDMCDLPTIFKKENKTYIVRTTTKESVRVLKAIFNSPDIDFNTFIERTEAYYKSGIMVQGFSNFLINNTWEVVYDDKTADKNRERDRKGIV